MIRPWTYGDFDAVPDIVASNMFSIMFPTITGIDGYELSISATSVQLPVSSIGQIVVFYLGHPVAFRGNKSSEHVVTVEFFENADGTVLHSLKQWEWYVRAVQDGTGGFKEHYAKEGYMYAFDTTGAVVHKFVMKNMWPMAINYPQFSQDSAPMQISAQFSVDDVELDGDYRDPNTTKVINRQKFGNMHTK